MLRGISTELSATPSGTSGSEVKYSAQYEGTNQALGGAMSRTLQVAETVAKNWREKCEREGKRVWWSPFDARESRVHHDTKAKCLAYMKKTQKMQMTASKLAGEPEANRTPREEIIAPKRTLEDLVTPQQAAAMRRVQEATNQTSDLRMLALKAAGGDLKATNVVGLPEGMAKEKLKLLSDAELKLAAQLSWSRGRRNIAKFARELCEGRGIALGF